MNRILLCIVFVMLFNISGYSKQCMRFNDNYALLPTSKLLRPTEQITIECWLKPEKYYNWGAPISYLVDNKYNESGFALAFNDGKMRFMIKTDKMRSQDWTYNPGVEIEINQWCHVAGVYDGKSIKFYLNGVLKDERYVTGKIDWTFIPEQLSIGAFLDNNELHHFNGCIDEVRIWNRGLSSREINKNMNMELSGEEDGLLLYLPFTEDGLIVKDYSKNHFDGHVINYTSDNRVTSLARIQPQVSGTKLISPSSIQLNWTVPNQTDPINSFYVDLAYDSKFVTKVPGFIGLKSTENNLILDNVPGGEIFYARVKGKAKNNELTANSSTYVISEFATSLTVDLLSQGSYSNNHFVILDDNILATEYYKFPSGTKGIIVNASVNSKLGHQATYGTLHIEGGQLDEVYEVSQMSNLVLSNLKPDKYKINLKWGSEGEKKLESGFIIEIDKFWWQNIWLYIILLAIAFAFVLFVHQRLILITRTRYYELLDGFMPAPEKELSITDEEITNLYNQLVDLMNQEKLYLEPRLNLKNIADRLDLPPAIVSKVVHDKYGHHFNDFVNKFRIEEVKRHLKDKSSANLKIVAIAYKCGFNSESTFFRVFKKYTGETPSGYQRKRRKSI